MLMWWAGRILVMIRGRRLFWLCYTGLRFCCGFRIDGIGLFNLSPSQYLLVTQDDLLHILSYLSKDLNFVNRTRYIGWREHHKRLVLQEDRSNGR